MHPKTDPSALVGQPKLVLILDHCLLPSPPEPDWEVSFDGPKDPANPKVRRLPGEGARASPSASVESRSLALIPHTAPSAWLVLMQNWSVAYRWMLTAFGGILVLNATFASSAPSGGELQSPDRAPCHCCR